MKLKLDRIISIATLATSAVALLLVLKKPQPVAPEMPAAAIRENAESFNQKIERLTEPPSPGESPTEIRLNDQEVTAALAQSTGALANGAPSTGSDASSAQPAANANGNSAAGGVAGVSGNLGPGEPDIKDYKVNFEGDEVVGQFLTKVAGKDVWVTVRGHLGSKDGYATFDPTEFKVGDLNVPVSLVNDQLQKKLSEQRDRMKLPDAVGGVKVENSEVVLSNK